MDLKRKRRPSLPTFDEFLRLSEPDSDIKSDETQLTLEITEGIGGIFQDPLDHFGFKSDTLEDTKEYNPYYPNVIN